MDVRPEVGGIVEITEDLYGYPAGSRATIVQAERVDADDVLVRFEETGHAMFVAVAVLKSVE